MLNVLMSRNEEEERISRGVSAKSLAELCCVVLC